MAFEHKKCSGVSEKAIYITGVQVRPDGLDGAKLIAIGGERAFQAHLDTTRKNYPAIKLLLSLSPDDNGLRYLSQDINGRQVFCQSVVEFLQQYQLDGLNLDAAFYHAQLETQAISGSAHFQNIAVISPHDFDALFLGLKYQFDQAAVLNGQTYLLTQISNSTAPLLNHSYPGELAPSSDIAGEMQAATETSSDPTRLSKEEAASLSGGSATTNLRGVVRYHDTPLTSAQERDYFRYSR
ncbi:MULTISPECIES: glycoside hydrolase family 18 protein [unclassified Pseudoalteromonas]|uniref:glycoside hydrolase family 18 protein n=1 Tax=unclassified Pseudoalteromonas TaxID=194690 RepID=UPI002096BAFF|nr:glycoside hydrolase family 18 protein [Pseudoalteromonas sp. XMcav2-N]MCO7188613.1 glycosyl hydrolase family 18 protein [Pseudoalteromonas sp. XMcav2-N]